MQLYVQRAWVRVYKGQKYRVVKSLVFYGYQVDVAGWFQWKTFKFYPKYGPPTYCWSRVFETEEEAEQAFKRKFDDQARRRVPGLTKLW
jgi:hypothetical protein